MAEWWLKMKVGSHPVDYANFTAPVLCDAQRSPLYFDGTTFAPTVAYPYAYQFDAKRLADFLQATAVGRGVEHIVGDIVATPLKHNGEIAAVQLATGERLAADLFVDCSGFRGLLINDALCEPFISFSSSLLCDRAVAVQIPAEPSRGGDSSPDMTATALSAGLVLENSALHENRYGLRLLEQLHLGRRGRTGTGAASQYPTRDDGAAAPEDAGR